MGRLQRLTLRVRVTLRFQTLLLTLIWRPGADVLSRALDLRASEIHLREKEERAVAWMHSGRTSWLSIAIELVRTGAA